MVALIGAMALVGNTYTASGAKPAPPPAPAVPKVVDANNVVVGQVVGTTGLLPNQEIITPLPYNVVVALNISIPSIIVQVTSTHILGNAELIFTNSSCTGQPYFRPYDVSFPFKLFPLVGVANGTLYAPRANSASVAISAPYSLQFNDNCTTRSGDVNYSTGIIADPISDLSTRFTPPYRFVYP